MNDERRSLVATEQLSEETLRRARSLPRLGHGSEPISLQIYHRDGLRTIPLADGISLIIGRQPPADIPIRDTSLSRRHARVERRGNRIHIEDLSSTNGTWLRRERIERAEVAVGDEIHFGSVPAAIQGATADTPASHGIDDHDHFLAELDREVQRADSFGRSTALLLFRAAPGGSGHIGQWLPELRLGLRPFDRVSLYSDDTVEVLMPEMEVEEAREAGRKILRISGDLRGSLATCPGHADSAELLQAAAVRALQRASARLPLTEAPQITLGAIEPPADGERPVAVSASMREVLETAERLASKAIPILILGETGTGKEIVAQVLHGAAHRRDRPFRCVNCGAIPPQLVESTLFGHEKGAFTGADRKVQGVFEAADGGTVLLDEVGELPPPVQAALLRVLEDKRITRVGSSKEIDVDVRVIAATHRDLDQMCLDGEFRHDLLYRLNAMTLHVPPLRKRPEDIGPLVARFVERANAANGCRVRGLEPGTIDRLMAYSWPGNVRELRNTVERAVVIAQSEVIVVDDLPRRVREVNVADAPDTAAETVEAAPIDVEPGDLRRAVAQFEARAIREALRVTGSSRKRAAELLNLPVRTMAHKMKIYGIRIRPPAREENAE